MKIIGAVGVLLLVAGLPGWAQGPRGVEVGVRGGYGFYGDIEGTEPPVRGILGVEACLCPGRLGLFAEYTGYFEPRQQSYIGAGHTFGGGVRIQGTRKIRPFLDLGLVGGSVRVGNSRQVNSAGMVLGGGVTFPVGKHVYIRPQVRIYPMNHSAIASSVGASFGWRF